MVFVTVGTHEQQFNRLVEAIDALAASELSGEEVFIQTGYSDYEPTNAKWSKFVPATEMASMMEKADVVVTHGGPSSFIEAMAAGKTPIVVPRRADLDEHVNDHQIEFVELVAERQGGIIPCLDVEKLYDAIEKARISSRESAFESHNAEFCSDLAKLIERL